MNKITKNIAALIAFGIGTTTISFAQVTQQKIGDNPTIINPNAALQVDSTTKGLLLPRLVLTATNNFAPLAAHVAGMTVYNTGTSAAAVPEVNKVTPGYYYNDGSQWVRIAKTEPWRQQTTTNEATDNSQSIYQTGSVAVGDFSGGASTKKMEVKGDFKSEITAAGGVVGTEVGSPLNPNGAMHYWSNGTNYRIASTNDLAATLSAVTGGTTNTFAATSTNSEMSSVNGGNSLSTVRAENTGNFFMESYNIALNFGSTFSLQNDGVRLRHTNTNGSTNPFMLNNDSEIFLQKTNGVRFTFRDLNGANAQQYWFPTTTGSAGQIMTQTATGKMVWSNPAASVNIYNANGTVTSPRIVTLNGNKLTFLGSTQQAAVNSDGSMIIQTLAGNAGASFRIDGADNDADGSLSSLQMQVFSDADARIHAVNDASNLTLGTSGNTVAAPIIFNTAAGAGANGTEKMRITGTGNVGIAANSPSEKLDVGAGNVRVRDINTNTGNITTDRVVVAGTTGILRTVPITDLNNNIYTSNGTLTANRTVTMDGKTLNFVNGTESILFNPVNAGVSSQNITGANRGNLTLTGGGAIVDLYVDSSAAAQLTVRGTATSMNVGTTTGQAKPLNLVTNGLTRATVTATGEMAIGATTAPSFIVGSGPTAQTIQPKLHVAGDISTTGKVWTTNSVYADYVFEKYFKGSSDINPNYEFKSLNYVKDFIKANNHLPGVESIADLAKAENGYTFDITKLTVQSLEKIEELYLHTIEQQDKIDAQQVEINQLKKQAHETNERLEKLELLLNNK